MDFGFIGCYSNVLKETDQRCSGRRECEIRIPDASLDKTKPCLGDLTRYYEADYTCLKGGCLTIFGGSTLRKDFVILQLYWWLFSSTKHCS